MPAATAGVPDGSPHNRRPSGTDSKRAAKAASPAPAWRTVPAGRALAWMALALVAASAVAPLPVAQGQGQEHSVTATAANRFVPDSSSVQPGDTVRWSTSGAGGGGCHNVVGTSGPETLAGFNSGSGCSVTAAGWAFSFAGAKAGTYGYECTFHAGGGMTGTVTVANAAPTASAGSATTTEDTPTTATVPASDANGDTLTVVQVSAPNKGTIAPAGSGQFTYTSNANAHGTDTFQVKVRDDSGQPNSDSSAVSFTVTITPVNDAPVAQAGTLSVSAGQSATGALAATDADGDALTYTIVQGPSPSKGTVALVSGGPGYTYAAAAGASGSDTFTFKANDGSGSGGDSNVATVTVTISAAPTNRAPVASGQTLTVVPGGTVTGTLAATDLDGDVLVYSFVTQPAKGTVTAVGGTGSAGFSYTAQASATGSDSFTFQASDGQATSNVATVTLLVNPPGNAVPTATNATAMVLEDTVLSLQLAGTDADGDTLAFVISAQPTNGTAAVTAAGLLTYTPRSNHAGQDAVRFTVFDGNAVSTPGRVAITVQPVNDAPVAAAAALTVRAGQSTEGRFNATDAEGDPLTFVLEESPAKGTVTPLAGDRFRFTAGASASGTDRFTFRAGDGQAQSNAAAVTLTILAGEPAGTSSSSTTGTASTASAGASGALRADFLYSPFSPVPGAPVQFTDRSDARARVWSWSFGDGTTSTERSPRHTFAAAGSYPVHLEIADAAGGTAVRTLTVGVHVPAVASPLVGPIVLLAWAAAAALHRRRLT